MSASFVTILGARGSVPCSGADFDLYGGATTSILAVLAGEYILLDAGTGLLSLPADALGQPRLSLLLSHAHLDHLCGLGMFPYAMVHGNVLDIYGSPADGSEIGSVLRKLYSPPVWPVLPEDMAATLRCHPLPDEMEIGAVQVTTMDGVHPGGVKLIRLRSGEKSVVFATDCTLTEELWPIAMSFARDCDLLLCDGQFSAEEWKTRTGSGHNSWLTVARFGAECGAKAVRIIHHAPNHTDKILSAAEAEVRAIHPGCSFARSGERIEL